MDAGRETRPPRGALVVVAVGLFATALAAWLSTEEAISAPDIEWVAMRPLPDSERAAIPGGGALRLTEAGMRATDLNAGGYRLYRVAAVVEIAAGSAIGQGRLRCAMRVPRPRTLVAQTPGSRASYPRSTGEGKELLDQGEVPEKVVVEFSAEGSETVAVELGDAFPVYTTVPGVTVSWDEFEEGVQGWQWSLPEGRPENPVRLGLASVWRTPGDPEASLECTLENERGEATVSTGGALRNLDAAGVAGEGP